MTEAEKFRTERLVARSWQIEDLPLAMELWGDPAVTALIDSRGKLTKALVLGAAAAIALIALATAFSETGGEKQDPARVPRPVMPGSVRAETRRNAAWALNARTVGGRRPKPMAPPPAAGIDAVDRYRRLCQDNRIAQNRGRRVGWRDG
jgi:hypothetical protein